MVSAWVLQCQREQEARNRQPAPHEELVSPKTQVAVRVRESAAPESNEIAGVRIRESFRTLSHSAPAWPRVQEQWELGTASVGHSAWRTLDALQHVYSLLSSTAISATTESPGRPLNTQSSTASPAAAAGGGNHGKAGAKIAVRRSSQDSRRATRNMTLSRITNHIFGQSLRDALRSLSKAAESADNKLKSLSRYRVKVRFALNPRRALSAAGAPLLALSIIVAITLFQLWQQDQFHVVAATSRMNHQSERGIRDASAIPPMRASHKQITDRVVLSDVVALSGYEIPALQRQAYYGDDSAALLMGMLYETGRYVPQSCAKAAEWVTKSATWGNAAAQYNLGLRYRDGDGVPATEPEAEKWLRKAADQKYVKARLALEALASDGARPTFAP